MSFDQEFIRRDALGLDHAYIRPREGSLEARIASIFGECLNVEGVGAEDDFFELGGDSVSAEALGMRITEETGRAFAVSSLAEHSTPRALARAMSQNPDGESREARSADHSGAGMPLATYFLVHGQAGYMLPKPEFVRGLGEGRSFHMFELPGLRDASAPLETIEDIARAYVSIALERQARGPYRLGSFCGGSLIAVEMASALAALGHEVPVLVLIDPLDTVIHDDIYRSGRWKQRHLHPMLSQDPKIRRQIIEFHMRSISSRVKSGKDPVSRRFPGMQFNYEARARLAAAAQTHNPKPYAGRAVILASSERAPRYRQSPSLWDELLPNRMVIEVAATHREILDSPDGRTAKALKEAFGDLD